MISTYRLFSGLDEHHQADSQKYDIADRRRQQRRQLMIITERLPGPQDYEINETDYDAQAEAYRAA